MKTPPTTETRTMTSDGVLRASLWATEITSITSSCVNAFAPLTFVTSSCVNAFASLTIDISWEATKFLHPTTKWATTVEPYIEPKGNQEKFNTTVTWCIKSMLLWAHVVQIWANLWTRNCLIRHCQLQFSRITCRTHSKPVNIFILLQLFCWKIKRKRGQVQECSQHYSNPC